MKYECSKSKWFAAKQVFISLFFIALGVTSLLLFEGFIIIGIGVIILGLLISLIRFLELKQEKVVFYQKLIVQSKGLFTTNEITTPITKILAVNIKQSFWGKIFNYGDLFIDIVGSHDTLFKGVAHPQEVKKYVESIMDNDDYSKLNTAVIEH